MVMLRLAILCALFLQMLASAQEYVEASGQTVIFDLKAGAKAAWDKNASPVQRPQFTKAKQRVFSISGLIDNNQITCNISGPLPVTGAAISIYRLDGMLVDRISLTSAHTIILKKQISNGYYWLRLELNKKSLAVTRLLVAR
jgi:hypothetical protein